jgi:hypothetical protein
MSDAKCSECRRVADTHSVGCSHPTCPHRKPQMWAGPDGARGFPGQLAEDRVLLRRMSERQKAVAVNLGEL